jgi:hypothetical protein
MFSFWQVGLDLAWIDSWEKFVIPEYKCSASKTKQEVCVSENQMFLNLEGTKGGGGGRSCVMAERESNY